MAKEEVLRERGMLIRGISLNVLGLNNPLKRRRIRSLLKKERFDLIYLQETHLWLNEEIFLRECPMGVFTMQLPQLRSGVFHNFIKIAMDRATGL